MYRRKNRPASIKPDKTGWPTRDNLFRRPSLTDDDLRPVLAQAREGWRTLTQEEDARIRRREEKKRHSDDPTYGKPDDRRNSTPLPSRRNSLETPLSPTDLVHPEGRRSLSPVYAGRSYGTLKPRRRATDPVPRGKDDPKPVRVFSAEPGVSDASLRSMYPNFLLKAPPSPPRVHKKLAQGSTETSGWEGLDAQRRRYQSLDNYLNRRPDDLTFFRPYGDDDE